MKKLILCITICFPFLLQAQYFHKLYGTPEGDGLKSGVVTNSVGRGHFLVGTKASNTFMPQNGIVATFTKVDGTPIFNKTLFMRSQRGALLHVNDVLGFELSNQAGFGIVGTYSRVMTGTVRPMFGLFYIVLNPSGNVVTIRDYKPLNSSLKVGKVGGLNKSVQSHGRELYITGTVYDNNLTYAFAMSISAYNGTLHWGKVYDLQAPVYSTVESGDDIIENPYNSTNTTRELLMIGNTHETPFSQGMSFDTYASRIDAFTGNPVIGGGGNSTIVHSASGDGRLFNGISLASTTSGGRAGFMVAGSWFDQFSGHDFCLTKVDSVGALIFQKVYPYNNNSAVNTQDLLHNVIERENTFGIIEYYAVGHTSQGNIGNSDIVVLKTDDNGTPVPNGQFTYGSTDNEYGWDIGQDNTGTNGGLSIFGSRNVTAGVGIGISDMYHIRAYFNGLSGCNERIDNAIKYNGGLADGGHLSHVIDDFTSGDLKLDQKFAKDYTICATNFIPNGSNARIAPNKGGTISPNPLKNGTHYASVELEVKQPTIVNIGIYDMLGRSYYTQYFSLQEGKNSLDLNISDANMAAGMYSVRIVGKNLNKSIMLMVK